MRNFEQTPDAATGTTTAKEIKQEVYVVTIDDVFDWDKDYHTPRVFLKKEDAIRYIKESYENINDQCYEYDDYYYTFDYEEGCCYACIYSDERWAITHWEIKMDVCEIENVANNRTDMEKDVYVVTIGEVVDWDKEYHQPRVFSKEEDAIRYVKESYEEKKDEFDEDRYIFEYDEGDWGACIYDDGRWTSDHWEILTAKCEVIL